MPWPTTGCLSSIGRQRGLTSTQMEDLMFGSAGLESTTATIRYRSGDGLGQHDAYGEST